MVDHWQNPADALVAIADEFAKRGWLRATSGNLSLRNPGSGWIYITRSGADKQKLTTADIIAVSEEGRVLQGDGRPSFETPIHLALYRATGCGAVFHVHTVANNVAARWASDGVLTFSDHEMLKALGVWEEGASVRLPVVPNYADIERVADTVVRAVDPVVPGVLLQRHGIYAFGDTLTTTQQHLEAFEFLLEWLIWDRQADALQRSMPDPDIIS